MPGILFDFLSSRYCNLFAATFAIQAHLVAGYFHPDFGGGIIWFGLCDAGGIPW